MFSAESIINSAQCTVYNIQCKVYNVQCTVHSMGYCIFPGPSLYYCRELGVCESQTAAREPLRIKKSENLRIAKMEDSPDFPGL